MTTLFLILLAIHLFGAIVFLVLAKKTSVLVDDDQRPIKAPDGLADEQVQLVRRIGAAP